MCAGMCICVFVCMGACEYVSCVCICVCVCMCVCVYMWCMCIWVHMSLGKHCPLIFVTRSLLLNEPEAHHFSHTGCPVSMKDTMSPPLYPTHTCTCTILFSSKVFNLEIIGLCDRLPFGGFYVPSAQDLTGSVHPGGGAWTTPTLLILLTHYLDYLDCQTHLHTPSLSNTALS